MQISGTSSAAPGVAISLCSKAFCGAGGTPVTTAAIRTTAGAAGAPSPWTVSSGLLAVLSLVPGRYPAERGCQTFDYGLW